MLTKWLEHPLTRGLDLDAPEMSELRKRIIKEKPFLHKLYGEWYSLLSHEVVEGGGAILEIGSGGGFLGEHIREIISSEIMPIAGVTLVLDGQCLPFRSGSLSSIVMVDVLHHIPNVNLFFGEALRCLKPGGVVAMIEPWATSWSSFVYSKLHYEPFDKEVKGWEFPSSGPLSSANGALPWIVFNRDRKLFRKKFSGLQIKKVAPLMPFCYLLSGGVSMRSFAPGCFYGLVRGIERCLSPWMKRLAMFALIVVEKVSK